jgi:hypothetical protein
MDSGLEPGELAVITRMVDPTPGMLISYSLNQSGEPNQSNDQNQAASEGTNDKQ